MVYKVVRTPGTLQQVKHIQNYHFKSLDHPILLLPNYIEQVNIFYVKYFVVCWYTLKVNCVFLWSYVVRNKLQNINIIWYWCRSPSIGGKCCAYMLLWCSLFNKQAQFVLSKTLLILVPVSHRFFVWRAEKIGVIVNSFAAICLLTTRCRSNLKVRTSKVKHLCLLNVPIFSFRDCQACALQTKAFQWPNQWRTLLNSPLLLQIKKLWYASWITTMWCTFRGAKQHLWTWWY